MPLYDPQDHSADSWALVTGASSGIGAAFARRLASQHHHLILVARREERLRELGAELERKHGVKVHPLPVDLSTEQGIGTVVAELKDGPPLALLVSAAGFATRRLFVEQPPSRLDAMIRLHVQAGVQITRAALPSMLERRRGGIIHVSSLAALFTTSRYVPYSATKAFLNTFCEGVAAEVQSQGVRVQALCAGLTRTEFLNNPEFSEFSFQQVPERFWMSADQVALESLEALARGGPVVFIPGAHNRTFVTMMRAPVVGALTRGAIELLGGRNLY